MTNRTFGRLAITTSRTFTGAPSMQEPIAKDTYPKDSSEVIDYQFDYSNFPEIQGGDTITGTPVVPASIPAGLIIGTPAVTVAAFDGVAAGKGVKVRISGGTAGTTYEIECQATFASGALRVVKGRIVVE